jgi:RimJ/RimL family protein N-acetyltransferase
VATTLEHLEIELRSADALGVALETNVPDGWPPGLYDPDAIAFFRDRLREEGPASVGWYGWYGILRATADARSTLVGSAGFFGPPRDGVAEIGYSVVESMRDRGYATEMVVGLLARARALSTLQTLHTLIAHTMVDNLASQTVLRRAGFTAAGLGAEPGTLKFTLSISGPDSTLAPSVTAH